MARNAFGGSVSDYVVSLYTLGSSKLAAFTAATLTFFDAETGGNQVTDLALSADGSSPVTQVNVPATGDVPTFYGPDGVTQLWVSANGSASRVKMVSLEAAAAAVTGAQAAASEAAGHATDAASSATAAEQAAASVPATTDAAMAPVLTDPQSASAQALDAAYVGGQKAAKHAPALGLFFPEAEGARFDGATDDTDAWNATIQAACDARVLGGGTIVAPIGVTLIAGDLIFPNDGASPVAGQKALKFRGVGASTRLGNYATPLSGSVIKFTGTRANSVAFIDTRGMGHLSIEDLTLTTDDTTGVPFIFTTNTILSVRHNRFLGPQAADGTYVPVHDAIILGGTGPNGTFDMTANARFQGYGTVIEGNEFDAMRRAILGQAACNSIVFRDNYVHLTCGGPAAIEIHSYDNETNGWFVAGNVIEVVWFDHGVVLSNAPNNMFVGNSWWDYGISGHLTSIIDLQGDTGNCKNNTFLDFFQGVPNGKLITDTAGGNQWTLLANGVWNGKSVFGFGANGVLIQPRTATGSENSQLIQVLRAGDESVSPNLAAFFVRQSGTAHVEGTQARFEATNGGTTTKYSWDGLIRDTGDLPLFAGTAAGNAVRVQRGGFKLAQVTTAARPTGVGEGYSVWDLTLHKPIYYDGSKWIDATGAAV